MNTVYVLWQYISSKIDLEWWKLKICILALKLNWSHRFQKIKSGNLHTRKCQTIRT